MARLADGTTSEELLQYLQGVSFPAHKDDIVLAARKAGAPSELVDLLQGIPRTQFASAEELIEAAPQIE